MGRAPGKGRVCEFRRRQHGVVRAGCRQARGCRLRSFVECPHARLMIAET